MTSRPSTPGAAPTEPSEGDLTEPSEGDLTETLTDLTTQIAELKLDLWAARDAAVGAVAAAGSLRARNAELEAMIHQLRVEVARLAHVEQSLTFRVGDGVLKPLKAARRLAR
ncbi:MAG: hypothetical protein V9G12_17895 [Microthrixaceae bacterium]